MDYVFYAVIALICVFAWIFVSGLWSMAAIKRAKDYEYHCDEFFKHASTLVASEAVRPALVQRIVFLGEAVANKKSAREFFFMFARAPAQDHAPVSQFDCEISGLSHDFLESLLKSVLHALLAISYQNFVFGFPLRALIATMIYDRSHQKQLAGRVYSSTGKAMKPADLAFHH